MTLNKAISSGKERRKPYRGNKSFDNSCRNHGGCPWCISNRAYHYSREDYYARQVVEEYLRNTNQHT